MGNDSCAADVWWNAIVAASVDSTLAGVLAGLLIAAAAALLVAWYEESDPHTIALFGSGVPALAFSTYLFTVIAGVSVQPNNRNDPNYDAKVAAVCSQMWSQWLLAMSLLFIGGAVLVCGLGWALVSYADNLAARQCEPRERPPRILAEKIALVKERRNYFIRLSGWLSIGIISTTLALLTSANVLYLKTVHVGPLASPQTKWYAIWFVFTVGLIVVGYAGHNATLRTRSALRANVIACATYTGGRASPPDSESRWNQKLIVRVGQEAAVAVWVAGSSAVATYLATTPGLPAPPELRGGERFLLVTGLYIMARGAIAILAVAGKRAPAAKSATPDVEGSTAADTEPIGAQSIRIHYDVGLLSGTTRSVVVLAIAAAFFDVALTQASFGETEIVLSLLLGGLIPTATLASLSFSIPAADDARPPLARAPSGNPSRRVPLNAFGTEHA
jgi:hypothetical protein